MTDQSSSNDIRIAVSRRTLAIAAAAVLVVVATISVLLLHKSSSSTSTSATTYAQEGIAAFKAHDFTLASQLFTQEIAAAKTTNQESVAYYNRGSTEIRLQQMTPAINDFIRSVNLVKTFSTAWLNLALAEQNVGNTAQALAAYQKLLVLAPRNAVAYLNEGVIYYKQGQKTKGSALIRKAIAINPTIRSEVPKSVTY